MTELAIRLVVAAPLNAFFNGGRTEARARSEVAAMARPRNLTDRRIAEDATETEP